MLGSRRAVLAAAVFVDAFAVHLVIHLFPFRYRSIGMSPITIGALSSLYSISQIAGGLLLGSQRYLDRRTVLLISFLGSAVSYALIATTQSIWVMALSRIIVGLVKFTITASKAMAAEWSDRDMRAAFMSSISLASTTGSTLGSLASSYAYKWHPAGPSLLAVLLFAADMTLVLCLIPQQQQPRPKAKEDKLNLLTSWTRSLGSKQVATFVSLKLAHDIIAKSSAVMQVRFRGLAALILANQIVHAPPF